jgi:hypothetical protein
MSDPTQPTPSGSKKRSTQPPLPTSESEDDPAKTPKKARKSAKAPPRNKSLWDHFVLNPDVAQDQQNKSTKV